MNRLRSIALAAGLAVATASTSLVLFNLPFAAAQTTQRADTMPRITEFDVQGIERLEPGAELEFTLWGTPGAEATLRIDGAQRLAVLTEVSPGVYQGVYTINSRDRIAPDARVTGNLRRGHFTLLGAPGGRATARLPGAEVLRMSGGTQQVMTYDAAPAVKVGDAVRIVDGALRPDNG